MSTSELAALSAPNTHRRLNTRALGSAIALVVPAAAAALPAAADATVYRLHYFGEACLSAGRIHEHQGTLRGTPEWFIASTSGFPGCGATNAANVGASVSQGVVILSVNNPNGYVATPKISDRDSVKAGCWNNGAHTHEFLCWSSRSTGP
jgi:hypothetical protein